MCPAVSDANRMILPDFASLAAPPQKFSLISEYGPGGDSDRDGSFINVSTNNPSVV